MSRIVAALALTVGLALGAGPVSPAAAQSPPSTYRSTAIHATNAARVRHDLRALDTDKCLQGFAARQAAAMARQESMYHQDLGPIMSACGLSTVGENVAYGYSSGRDVVRGWMHSPGHRANILNKDFRLVAVAARLSASGRWYAAQVFGRR